MEKQKNRNNKIKAMISDKRKRKFMICIAIMVVLLVFLMADLLPFPLLSDMVVSEPETAIEIARAFLVDVDPFKEGIELKAEDLGSVWLVRTLTAEEWMEIGKPLFDGHLLKMYKVYVRKSDGKIIKTRILGGYDLPVWYRIWRWKL